MDTYNEVGHVLAQDHNRRRGQRRAAIILFVSIALGLGAITYVVKELSRDRPAKVVIDPAKLPPIRPGPPQ
jgi:hypothetical protein